jgi:exodeoxyribonuclease VII small subunit
MFCLPRAQLRNNEAPASRLTAIRRGLLDRSPKVASAQDAGDEIRIAFSAAGSTAMSTKARIEQESVPVETLSFEAALKELEDIVSRLEQGEVDLEDSIALYERGQALKAYCEKKLKAAESRLEKIVAGGQGTEPLDVG